MIGPLSMPPGNIAGWAYFPPSWEKEGTNWGNTETLWPTAVLDRNDPRAAAGNEHVRKDFFGGFVEGTIQCRVFKDAAIHPYLGAYTVMASLIRGDDETVVEDFYWYLLHSTAAGQEIRVEHVPTHFGVMDFVVRGRSAGIQVSLAAPRRNPPKRIVLHLPASRPRKGRRPEIHGLPLSKFKQNRFHRVGR